MKQWTKGIVSVCLALAMVLGVCCVPVFAEEGPVVTEDGHVIAQPELLEQFVFPENWSKEALEFCVGNGILKGRGTGLAEKENTTRAETAALIVRLLGAQGKNTGLKQFTDAVEGAWYYPELSAAVELGIVSGTSATTLSPNAPITREQVFALLSRAFGIYPTDPDRWKDFTDGYSSSAYARNAISALAERGILAGYEDGSMRPKAYITRAELASLLYQLFTCICDCADDLPASGRVLYRGAEPIPEGYTLDGDLTIGCGWAGEQTLTGLDISGVLSLRPMPESSISLIGCTVGTLTIPAVAAVTSDTSVSRVISSGAGNHLDVPAGQLWIYGDCTVLGDCAELVCQANDLTVTLEGKAETCRIQGKGVTVKGSGSAGTVEIFGLDSKVEIACEELIDHPTLDYQNALNTVETVVIWDTVTRDTNLYSSSGLYGVIRSLPKGTKLEHYYLQNGSSAASVYTEDGVFGYVPADAIQIPTEVDIRQEPYSESTMEGFVEQKGYSSSTNYLIWVSLKTQTVNVFTGSKGDWELYRSFPCSSGKPSQPTVTGVFDVEYKHTEWDFGTYKVRYVTGFYEGYAFHSRTYSRDYSQMLDPTIGSPASAGCLRMLDADCRYIFDYIPYGTTVVVY